MARLTKRETEAVVSVLNERLTGGWENLRDALGLEPYVAEQMMDVLEGALTKLEGDLLKRLERGR
jgi:hypothetical protein